MQLLRTLVLLFTFTIVFGNETDFGFFWNIPQYCCSIYDEIIAKLQGCKNGNLGSENLSHGCLVQINFTDAQKKCIDSDPFKVSESK